MDWLSEYIKAWSRHGIHFGKSGIPHLNILSPPGNQGPVLVDDESLIYRFPHSKGGHLNYWFLDPASLSRLLDGLPEGLIIVLPIPEIWRTEGVTLDEFVENLDNFLPTLPSSYRYAIQLSNRNFLLPDYFDCLRRHNVAHVMHGSSDHPVFAADFGLILHAGLLNVAYAVRCALEEKKRLYVFVESSTEFSHLMKLLNHDLMKLSRIKRELAA